MSNTITPEAARDAFRVAVRKAQRSWKTRYYLWRVCRKIQKAALAGKPHCGFWTHDHLFMDEATTVAIAIALRRTGFDVSVDTIAELWIEWGNDE